MPILHDHRRRVPPQDIDRSIVVCVGAATASATTERRLALAAFRVDGPARSTGLRRTVGGHLHQMSATLLELVIEECFKEMPALVQDRPVEASLGPHIGPRCRGRTPRTRGHASGIEVFQDPRSKLPGQIARDPMVPVPADPRLTGGQPCDPGPGLGIPARSTCAPRQGLLGASLALLEGQIVDQPADPGEPGEQDGLIVCGPELVAISTMAHSPDVGIGLRYCKWIIAPADMSFMHSTCIWFSSQNIVARCSPLRLLKTCTKYSQGCARTSGGARRVRRRRRSRPSPGPLPAQSRTLKPRQAAPRSI